MREGIFIVFLCCAPTIYGLRPLTPYQRSFTAIRNISCSQCSMEMDANSGTGTYVERDMRRRQCLDEPEKFYAPCPTEGDLAPRGCAKLTTFYQQPLSKGANSEILLVRRFCASEGAEPEEIRCDSSNTVGGYSELCICGSDNCNSASIPVGSQILLAVTVFCSLALYR
ncbi:unnamed protein product [Calicophoron daubneyi]|uniref:Protein quiver n=1 Tax=Calicophoron daubneyi TaxID=300641 RepID=A0AAV2T376_CALDB